MGLHRVGHGEWLSLSLPLGKTLPHWDSVSTRQDKPVLSSFSPEMGLLPTSHVYSQEDDDRNAEIHLSSKKIGMRVMNSIRDSDLRCRALNIVNETFDFLTK